MTEPESDLRTRINLKIAEGTADETQLALIEVLKALDEIKGRMSKLEEQISKLAFRMDLELRDLHFIDLIQLYFGDLLRGRKRR